MVLATLIIEIYTPHWHYQLFILYWTSTKEKLSWDDTTSGSDILESRFRSVGRFKSQLLICKNGFCSCCKRGWGSTWRWTMDADGKLENNKSMNQSISVNRPRILQWHTFLPIWQLLVVFSIPDVRLLLWVRERRYYNRVNDLKDLLYATDITNWYWRTIFFSTNDS